MVGEALFFSNKVSGLLVLLDFLNLNFGRSAQYFCSKSLGARLVALPSLTSLRFEKEKFPR
jgi:hypothetical protein